MNDMKKLDIGYNFVENQSINSKKYEDFDEIFSIFEFIKKLKEKKLPDRFTVIGFDIFLYQIDDGESDSLQNYVRQIFSDSANYLMRKKPIILFIIQEQLIRNKHLKIRYHKKDISLTNIFGKTLEPKDSDWFHSNFNIS